MASKSKAAQATSNESTNAGPSRPGPVKIDPETSCVVLETNLPGIQLEDVTFEVFAGSQMFHDGSSEWLACIANDVPHHAGLSSWVLLSESVPLPVIDALQEYMEEAGVEVERELTTIRAERSRARPFARLSNDGLEQLVPAFLLLDMAGEQRLRGVGSEDEKVSVVLRGFEWK